MINTDMRIRRQEIKSYSCHIPHVRKLSRATEVKKKKKIQKRGMMTELFKLYILNVVYCMLFMLL